MNRTLRAPRSSWLALAAAASLGLTGVACSDDGGGVTPDGGTTDGGGNNNNNNNPDGGVRDSGDPMPMGCDNPPIEPPANGNCAFTAGTNGAVLLRGDVLAPEGVLENGHVLVGDDGRIKCAACNCGSHPQFNEAAVVACPDAVISPALINLHDHITFTETPPTPPPDPNERYDHRHDWRTGIDEHTEIPSVRNQGGDNGVWWGELRNLMAGATAINGSGGADGLLRNLDRSGSQQEGLDQGAVYYSTFPLSDTNGRKIASGCGYSDFDMASESRFENGVAYTPHIAEGIEIEARNEFLCLSGLGEGGSDVITDKTAVIHGVGLLPPDWAAMAAEGASLIWSNRTNLSLYGVTADVITARSSGVNIALGTDWTASGSMNILRELHCIDEYNGRNLSGFFSDRELWEMATSNAATAIRSADKIGSLAQDRFADVTIFAKSGSESYRAVLDADPEDVVLVLRAGSPLYGDANLMMNLPDTSNGCEIVNVCGVDKSVCSERETGATISQHRAAIASNAYDLFYCDTPPMEPSCIPFRTGEFMGVGSDTDSDGDGIPNDLDNCPDVFNPVRPLDQGIQADFDDDMVGDACDACPLQEGTSGCAPPDPNDLDGDGVPNLMDNCPGLSNMDQADRDDDMIGDVCDACPDESNLNGAACSASIYDIKQGVISTGRVRLPNVIVTAVSDVGYFVQHAPGDELYDSELGADYSGVFVFTSAAGMKPKLGDRVDVNGDVGDFFGQVQLSNGDFTILAEDQALPEPVMVSPVDVATEEPRGARLEGVLVQIGMVTVTELNPPAGPGDSDPTNAFVVDNTLRVNDYMYAVDPFPVIGETLTFVRGILRLANENYKLEPRFEADVGAQAGLRDLFPAQAFVPVGTDGVPPGGLQVRLTRPALADTVVTLTSSNPGLVVPGSVTIGVGETVADVPVTVTGLLSPVTLTASFDGVTVMNEVIVYDDTQPRDITMVTVDPPLLPVMGAATVTVRLSLPGATGGTSVNLSVTPAGLATVTASVTVAAGNLTATAPLTAGMMAGLGQVQAATATSTGSASIEVVEGGSAVVINEVDYDQPGADSAEFVELYNGSGSTVDLSNMAIVMVNGNGSNEYARYALSGTLAPGEYLVLGNAGVTVPTGVTFLPLPSNGVQNGGPDAVALVDTANGALLDALSYEGEITAASIMGLPSTNLVEGTATAAEDTGDGSLSRIPNGTDTDDASNDWAFSTTPTPGAANVP